MSDFSDRSLTENTRACYPIEHIDNALLPCLGDHPQNIIFLTCDAFGVLPPVSPLTPSQASYHFLSGYTAKVAGTEVGVAEPQATFSACFGAAFLVLHPRRYGAFLADKIRVHRTQAWLVNTGWTGGPFGAGSRIKLAYTRAIIDAIHDGSLLGVPTAHDARWKLQIPTSCPGVPSELLSPRGTWSDPDAYDQAAARLAGLFLENFERNFGAGSQGRAGLVRRRGDVSSLPRQPPGSIARPISHTNPKRQRGALAVATRPEFPRRLACLAHTSGSYELVPRPQQSPLGRFTFSPFDNSCPANPPDAQPRLSFLVP